MTDEFYPGWQAFREQIRKICIEKGATALDLDAFSGFSVLQEVWYGGSVEEWSMIPQECEQASVDEAVFDNIEISFAIQDQEEELLDLELQADGEALSDAEG